MTNLITEARELCEKARPGPYVVRNDNEDTEYFPFWVISQDVDDEGEWFAEMHVGDFPTAWLFARSRTLIPELCDALEKAQAEIERLEEDRYTVEKNCERLREAQTQAISILQKIDWIGSGAKGLIEDAIDLLLPAPPEKEGE